MANVNVTKADGTVITIYDQTVNDTYSFNLIGQNYFGYTQKHAETVLRQSENFAGTNPPAKAIRGQLWFSTTGSNVAGVTGTLKMWTGLEPIDIGYSGSTDSAHVSQLANWISVAGNITETSIGTELAPFTDLYVTNAHVTYGDFVELYVGNTDGIHGVFLDSTNIRPNYSATSISDGSGITIGTSSNLYKNVFTNGVTAKQRIEIGDSNTSYYVRLDASNTIANTVVPSTTFNLGSSASRLTSVYSSTVDSTKIILDAGTNVGLMSNFIPGVDNTYDIGSSNRRVANAHTITTYASTVLPSVSVGTKTIGANANRYDTIYAVMFDGTATNAMYADLAERYEADKEYETGTIVKLGGTKEITETVDAFDENCFGVISSQPAFVMNSRAGNNTTHPTVALVGRVPVKVNGKVKKFDRLVASSIPGVAMAVPEGISIADVPVYCVIGRALESKDIEGISLIEVVVGAK